MIQSITGAAQRVVWEPFPRQKVALACPAFETLFGGAKGGGKPLACDTPVPTPSGWTTQGALAAGDQVIGGDGVVACVLGTTGPLLGRQCFRMSFSDGTSVVADADHPWSTLTADDRMNILKRTEEWRAARRARRKSRATGKRPDLAAKNAAMAAAMECLPPPRPQVRTTAEIAASLYVRGGKARTVNHSIEASGAAEFPHADLPVPPYTLGAWLGDGTSAGGSITGIDVEILRRIQADGFTVTQRADPQNFGIKGLLAHLRTAGVLMNKHIPQRYLRASVEQRLELLRGLMDTDGMAAKDGSCLFAVTHKPLFDGFVELVRSLGIVVRTRQHWATCTNSKTRAKTLAYSACFTSSLPVFHLPRKLERQNLKPHIRYSRRFITAVDPVESVPVCCIKTDREDGLYLVGDQWIITHNTGYLVACVAPLLALAHRKWKATGEKQMKCRIPVFRKNLNDLKDFRAKTFELYPFLDPEMGADGWHEKEKFWQFSSGATVELHHLDGPTDHEGFNGNEFAALLFDEVQFISWEAYVFLVAQVRSSDPDYAKLNMVRCTANPGGPHGDWVKRHFHIDECPEGGKIFTSSITLPDGRTRSTSTAFIRSYLRDNPRLNDDGDYEARLRLMFNEDEVKMFMDGDFNCVAGSFFSKFLRIPLHFVKSHPIPGTWDMIHSTDWGSSSPACTLWGARDNDGRVYVIDELHKPGITGSTYGLALKEKYERQKWSADRRWGVDDFWGVIDKQAMDRYGSEATAAAGIMEHGFRLFRADKDPGERISGINQIKERLLLDRFGKPQLVIFEDRCPHLTQALKGILSQAPIDPDDYADNSPLSHAVDALRFMLMKWSLGRPDDRNPVDLEVERWNRIIAAQQSRDNGEGDYSSGYG